MDILISSTLRDKAIEGLPTWTPAASTKIIFLILCFIWNRAATLKLSGKEDKSMDVKLRIVTCLPLQELWRDDGLATLSLRRELSKDDIAELLRVGLVQFVVADSRLKYPLMSHSEFEFNRAARGDPGRGSR